MPATADLPDLAAGRRPFARMETTPRRMHVGHSTGGGEVIHYVARHGEDRVSTAVPISAVPPLMIKTDSNPGGLPKDVFDDLQAQLAANRAQFYYDIHAWRQGMMGTANAHCDGIVAFSQTDFTEDPQRTTMPVPVMHVDDDQIVRMRIPGCHRPNSRETAH
jgi:non-heme chloroperoxidase